MTKLRIDFRLKKTATINKNQAIKRPIKNK